MLRHMRGETRRRPGRHPHLCASSPAARSGRARRYSAKFIGRCEPDRSVCGRRRRRAAAVFPARPPAAFQSVRSAHARGGTLLRQPRTRQIPGLRGSCQFTIYLVAASLTGRFGAVGPNAQRPGRRTDRLRRFDNLNGPASGQSPPPTAFDRFGVPRHEESASCAFQKCFGSRQCQGAEGSGKAPRFRHLLCLGQVADPTTATVRTGRSSTAGQRLLSCRFRAIWA
eukprot:COSAG04_NODE_402_length_14902_cov_9.662771_10_plen_226_part_00